MVRLPGVRGAKVYPVVISSLLPLDSPVSGVNMKHRGFSPTEEERLESRKEDSGGEEFELNTGLPPLAHGDGRPPQLPGAAR